jgi:hypothetical protein
MKNISLFHTALIFAVALIFVGCKDDDEVPIGEPFDKTEGLTATSWIIDEVYLVDEASPNKAEYNISEFYTSSENRLEVKFDADGSFAVTPGDGLNFFPDMGTWSFDDPVAPRRIIIVDQNNVETIAPLGGPTRISDSQLKINFAKRSCLEEGEEKSVLGYRLVFNRKS